MFSSAYPAPPECFTEEFAHHERHGTLAPWGPVRDARADPDYDEPAPVGPSVIIPGVFLDAHALDPQAAPEELRTLLDDARKRMYGTNVPGSVRAVVEVPYELLGPLAAYADERMFAWVHTERHACRAAAVFCNHVNGHIRREGERREEQAAAAVDTAPNRPGHNAWCDIEHPGVAYCPPF